MNNEILSKARQLAQVKNEPEGSCDISKLSVALEMAEWLKKMMIEKTELFLIDAFKELPNGYGTFKIKREGSIEQLIEDFKKYMEV